MIVRGDEGRSLAIDKVRISLAVTDFHSRGMSQLVLPYVYASLERSERLSKPRWSRTLRRDRVFRSFLRTEERHFNKMVMILRARNIAYCRLHGVLLSRNLISSLQWNLSL